MNNPLHHVGQTARPQEASQTPDAQAGDAGSEARQQNVTDNAGPTPVPTQPAQKEPAPAAPGTPPLARKEIPDLEPGEPPPESSAGS